VRGERLKICGASVGGPPDGVGAPPPGVSDPRATYLPFGAVRTPPITASKAVDDARQVAVALGAVLYMEQAAWVAERGVR
jgi:hypothetical protein